MTGFTGWHRVSRGRCRVRSGSEAQHQQAVEGAQDPSLPAERPAGGSSEPSLVPGHHLPAHAARVPLPRGDHGLAHRKVLSWRLSNTLDADFCVEALTEAIQ